VRVCVCACVCVWVYLYVRVYLHLHLYLGICVSVYVYLCLYVHVCMYICVSTWVYVYAFVCECKCVRERDYMFASYSTLVYGLCVHYVKSALREERWHHQRSFSQLFWESNILKVREADLKTVLPTPSKNPLLPNKNFKLYSYFL